MPDSYDMVQKSCNGRIYGIQMRLTTAKQTHVIVMGAVQKANTKRMAQSATAKETVRVANDVLLSVRSRRTSYAIEAFTTIDVKAPPKVIEEASTSSVTV